MLLKQLLFFYVACTLWFSSNQCCAMFTILYLPFPFSLSPHKSGMWEKEKRKWVLFQVHMAIAMYCFRKSKIYSEFSVLVLIVLRINRINRSQSGWDFYHFLTCLLQLAVGISENYWTHLLNSKRQYINNVGKCSTGKFLQKKVFFCKPFDVHIKFQIN